MIDNGSIRQTVTVHGAGSSSSGGPDEPLVVGAATLVVGVIATVGFLWIGTRPLWGLVSIAGGIAGANVLYQFRPSARSRERSFSVAALLLALVAAAITVRIGHANYHGITLSDVQARRAGSGFHPFEIWSALSGTERAVAVSRFVAALFIVIGLIVAVFVAVNATMTTWAWRRTPSTQTRVKGPSLAAAVIIIVITQALSFFATHSPTIDTVRKYVGHGMSLPGQPSPSPSTQHPRGHTKPHRSPGSKPQATSPSGRP